jgi:SAM-dependent methyltransferase/uncharacterized protein YbaR (Trm112 family)
VRPDLPSLLPLVCPACRTRDERGHNLSSLSVAQVERERDGEILDGALRCDNAACGRRYPIVDGIPIVLPNLTGFLQTQLGAVVEGDLPAETAALLAQDGPDDAAWPHLLEHLSIYLDAHWGDRAVPGPDGPGHGFGMQSLDTRILERQDAPVERALELGCSVGRALSALAQGAQLAVGVELNFGALRRARRILDGHPLRYARRLSGRHYTTATVQAGERAATNVAFICADALDPPLVPGWFDRIAALNLIDSLRAPAQLLSVADALCVPGGELILASPYSWQSGIVDEAERLPADAAAHLRRVLTDGTGLEARYTIEEEAELQWRLRRDARAAALYQTHYLRARKIKS